MNPLLDTLAAFYGYEDTFDMLHEATFESVVPGICTECEEYATDVEPDQAAGYCENCDSHGVKSCLILAHII